MSQLTLTGETRAISRARKSLSPIEKKVYNVIRRSHQPRTERQLQKISALDDVGDIGRTLRKLREWGWIRSEGKPPRYEAVP